MILEVIFLIIFDLFYQNVKKMIVTIVKLKKIVMNFVPTCRENETSGDLNSRTKDLDFRDFKKLKCRYLNDNIRKKCCKQCTTCIVGFYFLKLGDKYGKWEKLQKR